MTPPNPRAQQGQLGGSGTAAVTDCAYRRNKRKRFGHVVSLRALPREFHPRPLASDDGPKSGRREFACETPTAAGCKYVLPHQDAYARNPTYLDKQMWKTMPVFRDSCQRAERRRLSRSYMVEAINMTHGTIACGACSLLLLGEANAVRPAMLAVLLNRYIPASL